MLHGCVFFLLFGKAWLLSEPWDSRMNREQLVNSEQTAALQETLHVLPAWLIDTHKHTVEAWLGVPHSFRSFLVHLCPLAGFLVWIWLTGNKRDS